MRESPLRFAQAGIHSALLVLFLSLGRLATAKIVPCTVASIINVLLWGSGDWVGGRGGIGGECEYDPETWSRTLVYVVCRASYNNHPPAEGNSSSSERPLKVWTGSRAGGTSFSFSFLFLFFIYCSSVVRSFVCSNQQKRE